MALEVVRAAATVKIVPSQIARPGSETMPSTCSDVIHQDHDDGPFVVVLVHGTFAREAEWIREDGEFARQIGARLPAGTPIFAFQWTGLNTNDARHQAGDELGAFIRRCAAQHPGRTIRIVSHSHGGNVALYALKDPEARPLVSALVFLGVPFLEAWPRNVARIAFVFVFAIALLVTVVCIGVSLALMSDIPNQVAEHRRYEEAREIGFPMGTPEPKTWDWSVSTSARAIVSTFALALATLLTWTLGWASATTRRLTAHLKARQASFLARFTSAPPNCRVFIGSVAGDEAALLLRTVDTLSSAPWTLTRLIRESLLAAIVAQAVSLVILDTISSAAGIPHSSAYIDGMTATTVILVAAALGLILLPPLGALWSGRVRSRAFGPETFVESWAVRIVPKVAPSWAKATGSQIRRFQPRGRLKGWRHCFFYADDTVINEISTWLGGRNSPQKSAAPGNVGNWSLLGSIALSAAVATLMIWANISIATARVRELETQAVPVPSDATRPTDVLGNEKPVANPTGKDVIRISVHLGRSSELVRKIELPLDATADCRIISTAHFSNLSSSLLVTSFTKRIWPEDSAAARLIEGFGRLRGTAQGVQEPFGLNQTPTPLQLFELKSDKKISGTFVRRLSNFKPLARDENGKLLPIELRIRNHSHHPAKFIIYTSFDCSTPGINPPTYENGVRDERTDPPPTGSTAPR